MGDGGVMANHYDLVRLFLAGASRVAGQSPKGTTGREKGRSCQNDGAREAPGLVLGVDPGSSESGYALVNPQYGCWEAGKIANETLLDRLALGQVRPVAVAIESIQSYGMAVGRSIFETCYQIGAILEVCRQASIPTYLYPRQEYARAICGSVKVTDSILRQALLLRFGDDGKGGPLHLLRGNTDKRSAFSVAVYHLDRQRVTGSRE